MLSERVTALFSLLQCTNTDIANFAGCSSANISKLKTGYRTPQPTSPSILRLANGIYGYANYENLLQVLSELCGTTGTTREVLIPALIAWLYETEEVTIPRSEVTPKSKRTQVFRRQRFGEKLDQAMTALNLTNGQLASLLNIDASLVSRYRTGIYSPHGNDQLSEALSDILLSRAKKKRQLAEFASLCEMEEANLSTDTVMAWLYNTTPEEDDAAAAQRLLRSLDDFVPGQGLPSAAPELPDVTASSRYVGTDGLRSAVVRFLSDAAREGGELLLYSDEPMDWMSGDRAYFALWASLMVQCVKNGVKIKIIHNLDREGGEMVDAIKGWFPLYISGMIEPYVFRKERMPRFHHTIFLRPGRACIRGFFPAGADNDRSYDYISDDEYLKQLKREYDIMLAHASPFLAVYAQEKGDEFLKTWVNHTGAQDLLLNEFPIVTAPESLLTRILARAGISEGQKEVILSHYHELRRQFEETLRDGSFNLILCLPNMDSAQSRHINFALSLTDLTIAYTKEEYAEHIAAIIELVERERNFHLTLLPVLPFQDIQIVTRTDAVAVLRHKEPYAAFVFLNPTLRRSVSAYFSSLVKQYAEDRQMTRKKLMNLLSD